MRTISIGLLMLWLFPHPAQAQLNLSNSRQTSIYTYIYKISGDEALRIYRKQFDVPVKKYMHTLIDSFRTDEAATRQPPPGNTLYCWAETGKWMTSLQTGGDCRYDLIDNDHDLIVILHTRDGQPITGASLSLGHRRIPYDTNMHCYHIPARKRGGILKVDHEGASVFFTMIRKPALRRYHNYRPQYRFRERTAYENKFRAFITLGKPIYKPGDTVHAKAFIHTAQGRPFTKPQRVRISDDRLQLDTIIGHIKPYRDGAYAFSFLLNDSLNLDLDENYCITLENDPSPLYDPKDYDGDQDDQEYAARRQVTARTQFKYEDYDLQSAHLSLRSSQPENGPGIPLRLFCKATDENDLPLPDARIQLVIMPQFYDLHGNTPEVFIKETLYDSIRILDPIGETTITLPDSIFPSADFEYTVKATLLTSDNQHETQTLYQHYTSRKELPRFELRNDSISISRYRQDAPNPLPVRLCLLGNTSDTIRSFPVTLPVTLPLDHLAATYLILSSDGNELGDWHPKPEEADIQFQSTRTRDSIHILSASPQGLKFWYTIFANQHPIKRGFTSRLDLTERTQTQKHYFVALEWLWAGKIRKATYVIPYRNLLKVDIDAPAAIFPGQRTTVAIRVHDEKDRPVENADLTALAYTAKFKETSEPYLPYLGPQYPFLKKAVNPIPGKTPPAIHSSAWPDSLQWRTLFHLDTIEFYKFLHPAPLYINDEADPGRLTQIAPFVSRNGQLVAIHMLYIDDRPVYFSQATQLRRYSWPVSPGIHTLRIRIADRQIRLDSIQTRPGRKTFICIDADATTTSPYIRSIQRQPLTMTPAEKILWRQYMIPVTDNFNQGLATISQDDRLFLLRNGYSALASPYLIGPLTTRPATFELKQQFTLDFQPEGGYQLQFSQGLLKERQLPSPLPFNTRLDNTPFTPALKDRPLSQKELDSCWQDELDNRLASRSWFRNPPPGTAEQGRLRLESIYNNPILWLLFRYDDPSWLHVENGASREIGQLDAGLYRLLILFKGNRYQLRDSLLIRPNGMNWYSTDHWPIHAADTMSLGIINTIHAQTTPTGQYQSSDLLQVNESFNAAFLDSASFTNAVSGQIMDDKGTPLLAAMICIKGTSKCTLTNAAGYFSILTPPKGRLQFKYIGYEPQEHSIENGKTYTIKLRAATNALNEVVVVGYSTSKSVANTGSVSMIRSDNVNLMLAGKVAGVAIQSSPDNSLKFDSAKAPAFDNIIPPGEDQAPPQPTPSSSIRRHFRDDAFWQPRLNTNKEGLAQFTVQFPDDITSWKTFAIAFAGKNQSGIGRHLVRAYKPLSARLAHPGFAIAGDSVNILGKLFNYTQDSPIVKRTFQVDGKIADSMTLRFANAHIDTFPVHIPQTDSLTLQYDLLRTDGYFDGEQKRIPIFRPGVKETKGIFLALRHDTTLNLNIDSTQGDIHIYASSSLISVLSDEIDQVLAYEYDCNEQMASKLMALLVKRQLTAKLDQPFKEDKRIRDLIDRLQKNRHPSGCWGWWPKTDPAMWVTLHVIEALHMARQQGYNSQIETPVMTDWLVYNLDAYPESERLDAMRILRLLGSRHQMTLPKPHSFYDRLRLLEWRQQNGQQIPLDSLLALRHETAFGNYYWGPDSLRLMDNTISNTVLVYRLLKQAGGWQNELEKIRGYFLETRQQGHWRNTYESTQIIATIFPDCIAEFGTTPLSFSLNGSAPITRLPYETTLHQAPIQLNKKGNLPLYFTAYQTSWNSNPRAVEGIFRVTSHFGHNGKTVTRLQAGQPVQLIAEVECSADASFVMIGIPVPSGCSYTDKTQSYDGTEIHREYFKEKVNIFCNRLSKGKYRFSVRLMPRFTGRYILGPALAECMYFPVFFGRESLRRIDIEGQKLP